MYFVKIKREKLEKKDENRIYFLMIINLWICNLDIRK